jgi:hypothetical protein
LKASRTRTLLACAAAAFGLLSAPQGMAEDAHHGRHGYGHHSAPHGGHKGYVSGPRHGAVIHHGAHANYSPRVHHGDPAKHYTPRYHHGVVIRHGSGIYYRSGKHHGYTQRGGHHGRVRYAPSGGYRGSHCGR